MDPKKELDLLEIEAILEWQKTSGLIRPTAILAYQGNTVAKIVADTDQALRTPVAFALATDLADYASILEHRQVGVNHEAGLVHTDKDGLDAIILTLITETENGDHDTTERVIMVARHDNEWVFETLTCIEDHTKVFLAPKIVMPPMAGAKEASLEEKEEAWAIMASHQEIGFTLQRTNDT